MKENILKLHYAIVSLMAKCWIVEKILVAYVEQDGEKLPCIYCTILRNAVLFGVIGLGFGYLLGT